MCTLVSALSTQVPYHDPYLVCLNEDCSQTNNSGTKTDKRRTSGDYAYDTGALKWHLLSSLCQSTDAVKSSLSKVYFLPLPTHIHKHTHLILQVPCNNVLTKNFNIVSLETKTVTSFCAKSQYKGILSYFH